MLLMGSWVASWMNMRWGDWYSRVHWEDAACGWMQLGWLRTRPSGLGKVSNADVQAAVAARARLAEAGVEVDADGRVAFSQAQRNLYAASPWNHDLPVSGNSLMIGPAAEDDEELAVTGLPRKFASRIHRHAEALAAAALWNDAGEDTRRIMLSAGGKGSGSDWIAVSYFLE